MDFDEYSVEFLAPPEPFGEKAEHPNFLNELALQFGGEKFHELHGARGFFWVPLFGAVLPACHFWLSGGGTIGRLDYRTWRSLNSSRYRDQYGGSAIFNPISYFGQFLHHLPGGEAEKSSHEIASEISDRNGSLWRELFARTKCIEAALALQTQGCFSVFDNCVFYFTQERDRVRFTDGRIDMTHCAPVEHSNLFFERYSYRGETVVQEFPTRLLDSRSAAVEGHEMSDLCGLYDAILIYRPSERGMWPAFAQLIASRDVERSARARAIASINLLEMVLGPFAASRMNITVRRAELLGFDAIEYASIIDEIRAERNKISHSLHISKEFSSLIERALEPVKHFLLLSVAKETKTFFDESKFRDLGWSFEHAKRLLFQEIASGRLFD